MSSDLPLTTETGAVTAWAVLLKEDPQEAARRLWERYFERLVLYTRRKLQGASRHVEDEEDVAIAAFTTFCEALKAGRIADVQSDDELWRVLAMIAAGKAVDLRRKQSARKRGRAQLDSTTLDGESFNLQILEQAIGPELDPSLAAEVSEEFDRMLKVLPGRLQCIASWKLEGFTNQDIADKLNCSLRTIARELAMIRDMWEPYLPAGSTVV